MYSYPLSLLLLLGFSSIRNDNHTISACDLITIEDIIDILQIEIPEKICRPEPMDDELCTLCFEDHLGQDGFFDVFLYHSDDPLSPLLNIDSLYQKSNVYQYELEKVYDLGDDAVYGVGFRTQRVVAVKSNNYLFKIEFSVDGVSDENLKTSMLQVCEEILESL